MGEPENEDVVKQEQQGDAEEIVASPRRARKWRETALVGLLSALALLWVGDRIHLNRLASAATELVTAAEKEHEAPGVEVASTLTIVRDLPLINTPMAKVEVFLRAEGGDELAIGSVEYEYAMENGQWQLKNSGGCANEECRIRGAEAFRKQ